MPLSFERPVAPAPDDFSSLFVPIYLTNRIYCETRNPVTRSAFLGRTGRGAGLLDKDYPSPAKGRRESGRRLHSPQMCSHALCCRFEPVRASLEGAIPSCRRAFGPYPPARTCRMRRRWFETGRRLRTRNTFHRTKAKPAGRPPRLPHRPSRPPLITGNLRVPVIREARIPLPVLRT